MTTFTQTARIRPSTGLNTTTQPEAALSLRALRGESGLSVTERLAVMRGELRLNTRKLSDLHAQEVRDLQLAGRLIRELEQNPHDAGVQGRITRLCRARLAGAAQTSQTNPDHTSADAARWLLTQARVTLLLALPAGGGTHPSDATLNTWRELDGTPDTRSVSREDAPLALTLTGKNWNLGLLYGPHEQTARAIITRLRRHEPARPTDLASLLGLHPRWIAHADLSDTLDSRSFAELIRTLPSPEAFIHPDWLGARVNITPERGLPPLRRGALGRLDELKLSTTSVHNLALNTLCLLTLSHAEFRAVWPRDGLGYPQISPLEELEQMTRTLVTLNTGTIWDDQPYRQALRRLSVALSSMQALIQDR